MESECERERQVAEVSEERAQDRRDFPTPDRP